MASHTPGPWYADGTDIGSAENVVVGVAVAGKNEQGYISHGEVQANAYLIAAGPEMLEALHKCRAYLAGSIQECDRDAVDDAIRDAIRKAEGRE